MCLFHTKKNEDKRSQNNGAYYFILFQFFMIKVLRILFQYYFKTMAHITSILYDQSMFWNQ